MHRVYNRGGYNRTIAQRAEPAKDEEPHGAKDEEPAQRAWWRWAEARA